MKYEFLEHTADIKIKIYGKILEEIFENATSAFAEYISRGQKINSSKGKIVNIEGKDNESLLCNFLNELIYLMDAEQFITAKAKVTMRGNNLHAELFGDRAENYKDLDSIKAATYSEIYVKKTDSGWEAQLVLDV